MNSSLLFFKPSMKFAVGPLPYGIALGDLNQDGHLDIVTSNHQGYTVSVLIGDGNGRFAPEQTFVTGIKPYGVALGDLNQDGYLDIVTTNFNSLSVFIGDGNGQFVTQRTFSVELDPIGIALGDLNHDNYLDIVVSNYVSNTLSVFWGDGSGRFETLPRIFGVGSLPTGVVLGDLNQDGHLDIATSNWSGNTLSVLINDGDGGFAPEQAFETGLNPSGIALGDLNQDGCLDIVVSNCGDDSISVFIGQGNGYFATQQTFVAGPDPRGIVLGDLNQDSYLDILVGNYRGSVFSGEDTFSKGNTLSALINDGNGGFTIQKTFSVRGWPWGMVLGDLNHDGLPDVVTANQKDNTVSVLLYNTVSVSDTQSDTQTSTPTDSHTTTPLPTDSLSATESQTTTQTASQTATSTNKGEVISKKTPVDTCVVHLTNLMTPLNMSRSCKKEIYYANSHVETVFNVSTSVTHVEINHFSVIHHVIHFIDFGCLRYENLDFFPRNVDLLIGVPVMNGPNILSNTEIFLSNVRLDQVSKNNFQFQDCPDLKPVHNSVRHLVFPLIVGTVTSFVILVLAAIGYKYQQSRQGNTILDVGGHDYLSNDGSDDSGHREMFPGHIASQGHDHSNSMGIFLNRLPSMQLDPFISQLAKEEVDERQAMGDEENEGWIHLLIHEQYQIEQLMRQAQWVKDHQLQQDPPEAGWGGVINVARSGALPHQSALNILTVPHQNQVTSPLSLAEVEPTLPYDHHDEEARVTDEAFQETVPTET